jgi:hypothetical protein
MTRKEFFEWLETCPTHKFNITFDEYEFVTVCFPTIEETDESDGEI